MLGPQRRHHFHTWHEHCASADDGQLHHVTNLQLSYQDTSHSNECSNASHLGVPVLDELHSQHQATTPHITHNVVLGLECGQALQQVVAHLGTMLLPLLFVQDSQDGTAT